MYRLTLTEKGKVLDKNISGAEGTTYRDLELMLLAECAKVTFAKQKASDPKSVRKQSLLLDLLDRVENINDDEDYIEIDNLDHEMILDGYNGAAEGPRGRPWLWVQCRSMIRQLLDIDKCKVDDKAGQPDLPDGPPE